MEIDVFHKPEYKNIFDEKPNYNKKFYGIYFSDTTNFESKQEISIIPMIRKSKVVKKNDVDCVVLDKWYKVIYPNNCFSKKIDYEEMSQPLYWTLKIDSINEF